MRDISDDKLPLVQTAADGEGAAQWISDRVPQEGETVQILGEDRNGSYVVPFPVTFREDGWRNAATGNILECYVSAWRPWVDRRK